MILRILKSSIAFIVIAVMGIFLLVMSIRDKIELSKPPANIEEMTEKDFYNGRFVEGDIYEIWGEYATLKESKSMFGIQYSTKTTSHYYLMPLETSYITGEPKFISLSVRDSNDMFTAEKMAGEFEDYANTNFEDISKFVTTMHVKGKITKLPKDGIKIFDDTLNELGFSSTTDAVHYVINVGNDGSGTSYALIIGIVVTLVGLGGTAISVIRGIRRGY